MTGTLDDSPISDAKAADRLKVSPNLTHAPAWQVVFDQATHMSFGVIPHGPRIQSLR